MRDKPLARLQQVFPYELQASTAAYELMLDDRSKLVFIRLRTGAVAIQTWRAGQAQDRHGYLLAGSTILSAEEVARMFARVTADRRNDWPPEAA
jgi:hypothetical protein